MQKYKFMLMTAAASMALQLMSPAMAQSESAQETTLQPVIVTAQKRQENLQSVPIAISVLSGNAMQKMQITDVGTLVEAVPGLQYSFSFSNPQFTIRGITNYSDGPWVNSAVNIYVDGVYQSDNQTSDFLLNDVEQVQVLKGPQGTLFGRNALAGVILVTTKAPSHTPSAQFDLGYGNFNTVTGKFYGTAGLSPILAADLAVYVQNQGDGWGKNLYGGGRLHFGHQDAFRSKWLLTPSDATTVTLTGFYERDVPPVLGAETINGVYPFVKVGPPHLGGLWDGYLPDIGQLEFTQYGGSLTGDQDFGWAKLVSITGVTYSEIAKNATKPAAYPYNPLNPPQGQALSGLSKNQSNFTNTRTYTEELQLKSPNSARVTWIFGAFFLHDRINNVGYRQSLTGSLSTTIDYEMSKSYAGFGQITVPVFAHTRLTLGARYTSDHSEVNGNNYNAAGAIVASKSVVTNPQPSATWNEPTWTAILDHDFSKRIMGYASYSRGYQSGQYTISSSVNGGPVQPQTLDAFEIGLKTTLANNKLRANTSLFHYKIHNLIVHQNIEGTDVETNAAAGKIDGIDLDVHYLPDVPVGSLLFGAGISYIRPIYSDYADATFYEPNPNGNGTFVTAVGDATGNLIQYSERLSGSLSANYDISTGMGGFSLNVVENYHSGAHYDPQGLLVQPSYSVVNASVDWTLPDPAWDIKLWSNNLMNAKYATFFANTPVMYMNPAPPRTFGIQFGYRWEK